MRLLEGSALLQEVVMRSLKSSLSSFPLTRSADAQLFFVANASKGPASSSKVPTGYRILA